MAHNRYYVILVDDPNIKEIEAVIVGDIQTQRYSLDKKNMIVKLCEGDHSDYNFLLKYKELTVEQAFELMQSNVWQDQTQLIDKRI